MLANIHLEEGSPRWDSGRGVVLFQPQIAESTIFQPMSGLIGWIRHHDSP